MAAGRFELDRHRRRPGRGGWVRRLALGSAALAGGWLLMSLLARQMLYPAPPVTVPSPPPAPLAELELELTGGGRVVAWSWPAAGDGDGRPAVLFFHGNGENLETLRRAGGFEQLAALGGPGLAVDYPGYGLSSGRPREAALAASATAALAAARRQWPQRPVVLCGWSLGAAVATGLAAEAEPPVAGLVALSPWTSLPAVAADHFPKPLVRLLLSERYDSLARAPRVTVPALVIHGRRDAIIPAHHGRRLAAALPAAGELVEIAAAGHNDLLAHDEVWRRIGAFLAERSRPHPWG